MSAALPSLSIKIGAESFPARLRQDLAPRSCDCLRALLPYAGSVIHARWSGEALWAPLAAVMPPDLVLPRENARNQPAPGEILLYAGELSEPELLITYGTSRFACQAGTLHGNPVLTIEDRLDRIAQLAHQVLWNGAMTLRIEVTP
ncbi:MAG TPA: DUF3830 family protein [Gammaproteobacteria bacterium]|nr:DUF3830 family protein [Gammaproteobacteria bacterium]